MDDMLREIPRWRKLDRLGSVLTVMGVLVIAAGSAIYDIARRMHDEQIVEDALKNENSKVPAGDGI